VASIIQVAGKWRALIRRKGFKSQCKTFPTKAQAQAWARQVEAGMDSGQASATLGDLTISDVIKAYRKLRDQARPINDASNEHYMLKALDKGLGKLRLSTISPDDLVSYATMRREEDGAGPYTINMDISKLGTVLRYGGAALRISPPDVVGSSRPLLTHLRLIGGGGKRERRPTEDELQRLIEHMRVVYGSVYANAVIFAVKTAMRRGEICSIKKSDIDQETRIIAVMRKHPRLGQVLERVPLVGDAMEFALSMPDSPDGRLFPVEAGTLSKYFTHSTRALSIPDLHFHDLRHEGASRLLEDGYQIPEVAMVTGHKKWETLKRYVNLKPEDITRLETSSRQSTRPRRGSLPTASPDPDKS
jgi:integrase